jgi:hypothetical protein
LWNIRPVTTGAAFHILGGKPLVRPKEGLRASSTRLWPLDMHPNDLR